MSDYLFVGKYRKVALDEAIKIGQKFYYDESRCKKGLGHKWVYIFNGKPKQCYECMNSRRKDFISKKRYRITDDSNINAKAIRKIDEIKERLEAEKDDYDFDFDDE